MENEELIGVLIETNDRLVAALEMYDQLHGIASVKAYEEANSVTSNLASMSIESPTTEAATNKGKSRSASSDVFHDLEDLNFGPLGTTNNLPPPMRPSAALSDDGDEEDAVDHRVTLSDYSDYDSSDEETHRKGAESSKPKRNYVTVSDDEDDASVPSVPTTSAKKHVEDDPFADPFADK